MRIVIDLQGAQTESRFRGIGRYSLSLTKAMAQNYCEHEIIIALNGLFPKTIEHIRAVFDGILPQENIRVWYPPGPVRECEPGNEWRRQAAECIREAFLASLKPDIVHISSLFEGYLDDAVTSIGVFDKQIPVVTMLYDLIPLQNPAQYLSSNKTYREYYLQKIEYLKRTSAYLCISEFVLTETKHTLGILDDTVVNISAGCDTQFKKTHMTRDFKNSIRQRFGLTKPFIMYTGGSDERKNLHRLIMAFARLSPQLRREHQLALVGKMPQDNVDALQKKAISAGLQNDELIFTGFITDEELIYLYNLCELFVFPSWYEGFGLPVLEAMSCGAPVIGANTSNLPELIGREDALFDPYSEAAIATKINEVLTNNRFKTELKKYGTCKAKQYSWRDSAQRELAVIERLNSKLHRRHVIVQKPFHRSKLAYVSPLPPEHSGVADYSAELLPELSRYYDIETIVAQPDVTDPWINEHCIIHTVEWFKHNADRYERVLYHFGNSLLHQHMFELLELHPGVTVLHDFFLSSLLSHIESNGLLENVWMQALYYSHGYDAVQKRFLKNIDNVIQKYPCNYNIIQQAINVIVHSDYALNLAKKWYNEEVPKEWAVIPLLRAPAKQIDRDHAREKLGYNKDDFIVCSFGILGPIKQNHRLLDAWLSSNLCSDNRCKLVFVGKNLGGDYGAELVQSINKSTIQDRISITGWVSTETYNEYLAAADMAVQLRTLSRGETPAAVLDCMNNALPTIVNAHGASGELPKESVLMLPDKFQNKQLSAALESLRENHSRRISLGKVAKNVISTHHKPKECARQYAEAIERFYAYARTDRRHLINSLVNLDIKYADMKLEHLSTCITQNLPNKKPSKRIFFDITGTYINDLKTGIQRVAKSLLLEMVESPLFGYRIEPVYLSNNTGSWHYRYARHYTLSLLGCRSDWLRDDLIEAQPGDKLIISDISENLAIEAEKGGVYQHLKDMGVDVQFIVYDLLPITMPQYFPPGTSEAHLSWLKSLLGIADGVVCISRTVADELQNWIQTTGIERMLPPKISWIHLGSDFERFIPSYVSQKNNNDIVSKITTRPIFLMVGTIEPRKGYLQVLNAFSKLWSNGEDINLVIIGKEGWKPLPKKMRRTILTIVKALKNHSQLGKRLFWLKDISDKDLAKIYSVATCLVVASEGEGFGLPLIEAAQHNVPIIARDIPVFREVAGEHAFYFTGTESSDLVDCIKKWLKLHKQKLAPSSKNISILTWKQSAEKLASVLLHS